jgi:hypothetical protein
MNNLVEHPTWNIQDSTKLQCFMSCPRQYFYNYVLGWQAEATSVHLVFGEAWHIAMETLLKYGYSKDAVDLAYLELERKYREHFSPTTDEGRFPKVPGFAYSMLKDYVVKYRDDHSTFDVLYTEISGSVSVGERSVHFKTDSILRGTDGWWKDKIFSLEHKTTGKHSSSYALQWPLKMQVGVYTHLLNCLYPRENIFGIIMNVSIFQKTNPGFTRIEVPKTIPQMETWLWTANHWLDQVENEYSRLTSCKEEDPVLRAFPMNSEYCSSYFGCIYHDYCVAWSNPLQNCSQVPFGFTTRYWDPSEIQTTHKMEV